MYEYKLKSNKNRRRRAVKQRQDIDSLRPTKQRAHSNGAPANEPRPTNRPARTRVPLYDDTMHERAHSQQHRATGADPCQLPHTRHVAFRRTCYRHSSGHHRCGSTFNA